MFRRKGFPVAISAMAAVVGLVVALAPNAIAAPVSYKFATWNMQGATASGASLWQVRVDQLGVADLAVTNDIVALQEAGATKVIDDRAGTSWGCVKQVKMLRLARVCEWTISKGGKNYKRVLYFVEADDLATGTGPAARKANLAFVINPTKVEVRSWNYIPPVRSSTYHDGDRGLLQLVLNDGTVVYSGHADARPEGINIATMLLKAREATERLKNVNAWVLLADFNATPNYLRPHLREHERLAIPGNYTIRGTQRVVDYLVWWDEAHPNRFAATVVEVASPTPAQKYASDHRPVRFVKV
ncbi:endonuclease/exonuclease/phosphatase family protein [Actinokineospora cianjurensis]|nr:endonuclease/exonuclease/phosphatase family protein [Actinokineospora cianjurensis]